MPPHLPVCALARLHSCLPACPVPGGLRGCAAPRRRRRTQLARTRRSAADLAPALLGGVPHRRRRSARILAGAPPRRGALRGGLVAGNAHRVIWPQGHTAPTAPPQGHTGIPQGHTATQGHLRMARLASALRLTGSSGSCPSLPLAAGRQHSDQPPRRCGRRLLSHGRAAAWPKPHPSLPPWQSPHSAPDPPQPVQHSMA